jgi:hypothetical protein
MVEKPKQRQERREGEAYSNLGEGKSPVLAVMRTRMEAPGVDVELADGDNPKILRSESREFPRVPGGVNRWA